MTEQTQSLRQQVQQQVTQSAQDFYGNSVGGIKGRIQNDRTRLESLVQQMSQGGSAQAQVQEMIDSYNELESAMDQRVQDQATQDQGVREKASQALQQTQQSPNGAGQQVQDTAEAETGESDVRTTERTVDQQGYIVERILDESGGVLGEDVIGNVVELPVEEEYIDEQGWVVSRVRDDAGNAYEMITDDGENMVEARAI